ncbi:ribosomal protein L29 [Alkalibacillus filiformis]|uniref:Ribosomal protein L29 n=1 Tax=Alkalibacillus filiformis TaxID=200990 RepID=A0ABU0DVV1_9BACI|nr:SE1832 family protein [Alkalibacillus filiformis]MDQ0352572.1 ribosomal protein L29 [Alkalibacillus filiformis]
MTKEEIQTQIDQLKMDYIRIQGDLDKLEANGGNVAMLEKSLNRIEDELASLRKQMNRVD